MSHRTRLAPFGIAASIVAAGALLLSACSAPAQAHWTSSPGGPGASSSTGTHGPGKIVIAPDVATGVSPGAPVTVTATAGAKVTSVSLTHGSKTVAGALAADGSSWTATGAIAFNTKYTLKVVSSNSTTPTRTTTFTTVNPRKTVSAHLEANKLLGLQDGGTYGVGQIIMVYFPNAIPTAARPAIEQAMKVDATPAVEGRWHFIDAYHADYRPQSYWATGTTITVNANVLGVKIADGVYGGNSPRATIHIGDSHILIANNKTHRMKLYVNGTLTHTIKVSMGMGGSTRGAQGQFVNYWTRSGPHIVIQKTPSTVMSSASYGVTDKKSPFYYAPETVYDTVRISYSGEFVHLRTWSVGEIGVRNTSHGCINVGKDYAGYLYKFLIPGDIVDVTGTPVKIGFDNTQADWGVNWADWN